MVEKKKYKCITACTWLKRYWPVNSIYEGTQTPPIYFEPLGDGTEEPEQPDEPETPGCNCHCCEEHTATDEEFDEMLADIGLA